MNDAAHTLYKSLDNYSDIEKLIEEGETESLLLECKAPQQPRLNRKVKNNLAIAISGFSNTAGGVIIWGMNTEKHSHSNLDILTQIVPIGSVGSLPNRLR